MAWFKPGHRWRFLAHKREGMAYTDQVALSSEDFAGRVQFDELVIDQWFHIEQMDERHWWMQVCDRHINVFIDVKGNARITSEWDDRPRP